MKRFMGIDPGLANTGYGVIEAESAVLKPVGSGCIKTVAGEPLTERLAAIHAGLTDAVERLKPDEIAIEQLHSVARFARIAILMGHARGVAMLVAAQFGIPVLEFQPTMAKSIVTGFGRASKEQIKLAVTSQLGLAKPITNEHIADAFAVSICAVLSQGKATQATKKELQKVR